MESIYLMQCRPFQTSSAVKCWPARTLNAEQTTGLVRPQLLTEPIVDTDEVIEEDGPLESYQEVLTEGIPFILWDSHIPEDMIKWLKQEGNGYQDGWQFTWFEMLDRIAEIDKASDSEE